MITCRASLRHCGPSLTCARIKVGVWHPGYASVPNFLCPSWDSPDCIPVMDMFLSAGRCRKTKVTYIYFLHQPLMGKKCRMRFLSRYTVIVEGLNYSGTELTAQKFLH